MHATEGRRLWKGLHTFAENVFDGNTQRMFFSLWFSEVEGALGCSSCFRKLKWFREKWPEDYGQGFGLWSQCLHDYVNKELGKPLFLPDLTLAPLRLRGIIV